MAIKVVTDSTSYIPVKLREQFDISMVSLSVHFENESFLEDQIDNEVFYKKMAASANIPTSSQPSPQDLYDTFEKHILQKNAVVGVFLSSDMSGTYSTAQMAKKQLLEKYPEAEIELVDSRSNSMQLGFAALAAAKAAKKGLPMGQVLNSAKKVIENSRFLFVPETLTYLKKGGRIGGAAALLGSILQIRPILTVTDGKTALVDKVRTQSRAIQNILNIFYQDVKQKGLGEVVVHHINNEAEGNRIAREIEQHLGISVDVFSIGPVIGLHVGPGTVGIVYYTDISKTF
ncbi:DegV family protein [Desulfofalx alkaliphila]|uniref:DegV family protein n=1 Tax=Desulfofalx alkaliphila TaxID=105483 RepID=UPI0004E12849|nr:DegV family protein [Desulfofalx alkaliphila]